MANNEEKGCPRNCRACTLAQQMYCAAQMSLSTMDLVQTIYNRFDAFETKFNELVQTLTLVEPPAQEGAAAQTVDSPKK